jgi:hypothetical protein
LHNDTASLTDNMKLILLAIATLFLLKLAVVYWIAYT